MEFRRFALLSVCFALVSCDPISSRDAPQDPGTRPPGTRVVFQTRAVPGAEGRFAAITTDAAWSLVESSIELCDGTPALVEADLDTWVDTVGSFCPWSAYVVSIE